MAYDPETHHRRTIRLKGYDYTQAGAYFVTVVTHGREGVFGEVVGGDMQPNDAGRVVEQCWVDIPCHFMHVALDAFVVMPNHIHGIVMITDGPANGPNGPDVGAGSPRPGSLGAGTAPLHGDAATLGAGTVILGAGTAPLRGGFANPGAETAPLPVTRPTLGQIVAYFKYQSAKSINRLRGAPGTPVWQRDYYEHIVRDESALHGIREYIVNNPLQWAVDRENPARDSATPGAGTAPLPLPKDEPWRV